MQISLGDTPTQLWNNGMPVIMTGCPNPSDFIANPSGAVLGPDGHTFGTCGTSIGGAGTIVTYAMYGVAALVVIYLMSR